MKIKIQSIRDFFKSKEKKGLKPIFFESIGDQNTSRNERLKNLIKILEKNGFKIKNKNNFYQRIYQRMQSLCLKFWKYNLSFVKLTCMNFKIGVILINSRACSSVG